MALFNIRITEDTSIPPEVPEIVTGDNSRVVYDLDQFGLIQKAIDEIDYNQLPISPTERFRSDADLKIHSVDFCDFTSDSYPTEQNWYAFDRIKIVGYRIDQYELTEFDRNNRHLPVLGTRKTELIYQDTVGVPVPFFCVYKRGGSPDYNPVTIGTELDVNTLCYPISYQNVKDPEKWDFGYSIGSSVDIDTSRYCFYSQYLQDYLATIGLGGDLLSNARKTVVMTLLYTLHSSNSSVDSNRMGGIKELNFYRFTGFKSDQRLNKISVISTEQDIVNYLSSSVAGNINEGGYYTVDYFSYTMNNNINTSKVVDLYWFVKDHWYNKYVNESLEGATSGSSIPAASVREAVELHLSMINVMNRNTVNLSNFARNGYVTPDAGGRNYEFLAAPILKFRVLGTKEDEKSDPIYVSENSYRSMRLRGLPIIPGQRILQSDVTSGMFRLSADYLKLGEPFGIKFNILDQLSGFEFYFKRFNNPATPPYTPF